MSIKKKKSGLSFVSMMFFVLTFLFSSFSANIGFAQAATDITPTSVSSYTSYKTIYFYENGVSTLTVVVGCAADSGDLYDMNTGKPCPTNKPVLIGCAAGSGDLYDVNTGKRCTNNTAPIVASCSSSSDIYDMNTGKPCANNITASIKTKTLVASENKEGVLVNESNKLAINIASSAVSTEQELTKTEGEEENILADENSLSGREKIGKSLAASANKIGSIISGPMSIWIILLIVAILLGGGYGIYNLLKKDEEGEEKEIEVKSEVKQEVKNTTTTATPIIPQANNPIAQSSTVKPSEVPAQANTSASTSTGK